MKRRPARLAPKIANIKDYVRAIAPKKAEDMTRREQMRYAVRAIRKQGLALANDGRVYVPSERLTPYGRIVSALTPAGFRWQNGQLIPRHAK